MTSAHPTDAVLEDAAGFAGHLDDTAQWRQPPSVSSRVEAGRRLRVTLPREQLGAMPVRQSNPLDILDAQNASRLQNLVPLRTSRMAQSPFAFYRGTAAIMAADFALTEHTGLLVPSCGDAHVSNFGFYASPQRDLVFDLNDFDEAAWAPWEWDLKRLIASIVIAGRASSRAESVINDAVITCVRAYASHLAHVVTLSPRTRLYQHVVVEPGAAGQPERSHPVLDSAIAHARKRTGERTAKKLTTSDPDGRLRFIEQPPTMTPLAPATERRHHRLLKRYLDSAAPEIQLLLNHYVVSDAARRVVGVGSVGTRCALTLLQDGDGNALILQSKQAQRSVLEQYGGISQPRILEELSAERGQGARVVVMQRLIQGVSDPFLGYLVFDELGLYVRQFRDMKGGIDADTLDDEPFINYATACAVILAHAHGQTRVSPVISGYIGHGSRLGPILLEWGHAYADLSFADYRRFLARTGVSPDDT